MISRFLFSAILMLLFFNSKSQDQSKLLGKINIASPNSASLGKYGDYPVSYHTGIPSISIPIHTLTSGNIMLPVSVNYHAGGLKVEEQDSWVGAGWTLVAGGAITRTVMDKPDEKQTSSLAQTHGHFSDYGFNSNWVLNGQQPASTFDSEPDIFSFSFNGYSGKFYFNDDRTPMLVPEQDIRIEYNYTSGIWNSSPGLSSGLGRCIESFIITTPDGTKYYFGIPNQAVSSPYCDPIEVLSTYTSAGGTNYSQVISSWYLHKIESADGNFTIDFKYVRDKFAYYTYVNNFNSNNTESNNRYTLVKNYMAGVKLSKITSKSGNLDFTDGPSREDLSRWEQADVIGITDNINQTSKALGGITYSDPQGNCQKKFTFSYSYFIDNNSSSYFTGIISDKKRLKLNSIGEQNCDGSILLPAYTFDYHTEQVLRKLSFGRDHWGYNNGVNSNSELYPALYNGGSLINTGMGLPIANRESAWPAMRAGALNKITFPTGGYTSFEFEPNQFYVLENGNNVNKTVGGLRIKSMTSYDPVSSNTITTNYSYLNEGSSLSSGILFSKPTYIQLIRNEWNRLTYFSGATNGCYTTSSGSTVMNREYRLSDNSLRPMETTQGNHIGYERVKVSQTGNGYSIYKFSISQPWAVSRDGVATTSITNPTTCDLSIPSTPAAPLPTVYQRGEPVYEGHFNESGNLLSEKLMQSTYQESSVTIPGRATWYYGTANNITFETFYEIKTAKKSETLVTQRQYQPGGGVLQTQIHTYYESNYHTQPTKIVTTDSKGLIIEKRLKYAFDFRVPIFENVSNCYSGAASYISYFNNLFYSNGYATQFATCGGPFTNSCWGSTMNSFISTLATARKNYVDCRKTNFTNKIEFSGGLNTYQVNHNSAKASADAELKPILWMQDVFMNPVIEESQWKNNLLVSAIFNKYSNERDDAYGIYPEKNLQIQLSAPSNTFTASQVSSSGTSITKDSRYSEQAAVDFTEGNMINILGKDGVNESYGWGYDNSRPIAKVVNATNKYKEKLIVTDVTQNYSGFFTGYNNYSFGAQISFQQVNTGSMTFSLPAQPDGAKVTAYITLNGPSYQSTTICRNGNGGPSCSVASSITFANMPAGNYTLNYTLTRDAGSFSYTSYLSHVYVGKQIGKAGTKEFFVQNFEEDPSATVGFSNTGVKYYNGTYTTTFSPPAGRNYVVQWWKLVGNQWQYNTQNYTVGMQLSGPVDDVRIFPTDAHISTYTYSTSGNMTSEINPNGIIQYYDYDPFGRLIVIRDKDKRIIKRLCYNYAGQTENCTVNTTAQWISTGNTRCKPCPSNQVYTTNILQEEKFDSNPNSLTYNQYQWIDVGVNSNCGLASWQNTTTPLRCQINGSNQNTGYQEQEQRDMNPCSPTYNNLRWVISGYNTSSCPLAPPPIYARIEYDNYSFNGLGYVADVVIRFYSDQNCTTPVSVSNLAVNYREFYEYYDHYNSNYNSSSQNDVTVTANGTYYLLGYSMYLSYYGWASDEFWDYVIQPGSGYLTAN